MNANANAGTREKEEDTPPCIGDDRGGTCQFIVFGSHFYLFLLLVFAAYWLLYSLLMLHYFMFAWVILLTSAWAFDTFRGAEYCLSHVKRPFHLKHLICFF